MSKALRTVLVGVAAFFVGGLLFVGRAGAVTSVTPALSFATSPEGPKTLEWFLGEDGTLWYTVIDDEGLVPSLDGPILNDGNTGGPYNNFFAAANGTGFVNPLGLTAACGASPPGTCPASVSIYAKVPSAGQFIDGPAAFDYGKNANMGPDMDQYIIVQLPGLDKTLWYMLYDRFNKNFAASTFGANVNEPYAGVAENANSGFALATGPGSIAARCAAVTPMRACVGIFVRKP